MGLFDFGSDQTDLDTNALYAQNNAGAATTPQSAATAAIDPNSTWARGSNDVVLGGDWATQFRNNSVNIDPRDYMYGRTAGGADFAANRALNTGQSAQGTGEALLGDYMQSARDANARQALGGNWTAPNASLGTSAIYGNQLAGLENQQGPSAAQAQLQQGTNQAMASQLALARSGRGFGGNAAAMGQAQSNMAGIQGNQATAASQLRAQEDAAWRQRQAANLGNAAGIYQGIGQQQANQVQSDVNSAYQNRAQNDASALGYSQLGANSYFQGVNANLAGQQGANQVRQAELGAGATREDNMLRQWSAVNGYNMAEQQRQDQQDAAAWGAVGAGVGYGITAMSDVTAKKDIQPSQQAGTMFARGSDYGPLSFDGEVYRDAPELEMARAAPGSFYNYKDPNAPGAAPGRHYGPMAQDLAKTPAGASAVVQGKDGKLGVDTGRLSLVNTGAINAQQKQLDQQKAEDEKLKSALVNVTQAFKAFGAAPSQAPYPGLAAPGAALYGGR